MEISKVRARVFTWTGEVYTGDTKFTTPMTVLPFQSDAQAVYRFFSWLVVEIETSDGLVGIGNAGLAPDVCKTIIDNKLAPQLIGENPLNTDYLYQKMYRSTIAFGRKGAALAAISALDIALWDIKGQAMKQPVFMLMGGRTKDAIDTYYSRLYTSDLDQLSAEAQQCKAQGFTGMKMRFAYSMREGLKGLHKNIEMVKTVRDAVGYDVDLMAECYMGLEYHYAKRLLQALEPYDLRWVEEPLIPDEIHLMAKLRGETPMPISGGEHAFTRYGFHDIINAGALDILQFDTNRVGGFTEAQRICHMAEVHGLHVIPHGGQMHNLHVVMSSFASPLAEYFPQTAVEVGNELFWYIFDGEKDAVNGRIQLDDTLPGMGLTLKDDLEANFDIKE